MALSTSASTANASTGCPMSETKQQYICDTCGVAFETYPKRDRPPPRFCAKRCYRGERSLPQRFFSHVSVGADTSCWMWTSGTSDNYGSFGWCGRRIPAHRASWLLHGRHLPPGLCVLHRCDVRRCVNPQHLFVGTRRDNNKDRNAKGRQARGETNAASKLKATQVLAIRMRCLAGERQIDVASSLGLAPCTISQIVNRKRWAHL